MRALWPNLARFVVYNASLNLAHIAEVLKRHDVDYVVIGGLAVVLQGGETTTHDVDLAFDRSRQNLDRLADALTELSAKPKRWKAGSFRLKTADLAANWLHLESDSGDIDLIADTPGVSYQSIKEGCEKFELDHVTILVASVAELIEMKRRAGRPKDKLHLAELEDLLRLQNETRDDFEE